MRNLHACLVHEEPECVADLVANLRHHDPDSLVLLYDGSQDRRLTRSGVLVEGDGVLVHPDPRPMCWGRLHGFAFDSFRYALDATDFTSMTIVDSDQLLLRSGYSEAVAAHLRRHPHVGCLVSRDGGTQPRDTRSSLASMAWREFDLWRPFLRRFAGGERHWPTWTFWPGTVFSRDAAAEVAGLADDPELVALLGRTRLWATEELVLPTLVGLLGHGVAPTPFRDDLVRFRVRWTVDHVRAALQHDDAYWVHPVPRRVDDQVRGWLRDRAGGYPAPGRREPAEGAAPPLLEPSRVLARVARTPGRLTGADADLMMSASISALTAPGPSPSEAPSIVTMGTECARTSLLLEAVTRSLAPAATVERLDPPADRRTRPGGTAQPGPPVVLAVLDGGGDVASLVAQYSRVEERLAAGAFVVIRDYPPERTVVTHLVDHLVGVGALEWLRLADGLVVTRFVEPIGLAPLDRTLADMDRIDGWLSRDEAAYLAVLTARAFRSAPKAAVVEVGSYCGRGTLVLARASRVRGRGQVHAIDTFDGVVGSAPEDLHDCAPSWDRFQETLRRGGLQRRVRAHRGRSGDLAWDEEISLLLVDGWHDYESVRADVEAFEAHVVDGGVIAFHDHADYAPGVSRVLDELVTRGGWERCGSIGTMAAVRRSLAAQRTVATDPRPIVEVTEPARVSCLMPTADRPGLVRFALETFDRQTHVARELVVVDDGAQPVEDLLAHDPRVIYVRPAGRLSIGAKRSLAAQAATGGYLAHWDDDDWYTPDRLRHQVTVLEASGLSVVGATALFYWEPASGRAWRYHHAGSRGLWAHDATLLHRRALWQEHPYPDRDHGIDAAWLGSLPQGTLLVDNEPVYVGLMHPGNTSRKNTSRACWQEASESELDSHVAPSVRADWSRALDLELAGVAAT